MMVIKINIYSKKVKKFVYAGIALASVLTIGTLGYWFIGEGNYSVVDSFYMTFITIATIGYSEVIDLDNNPLGRLFTVFIALSGIGVATYIITNLTAFMVDVEISEVLMRKKMNKQIKKLKNHYIVCGVEGVGFHIIKELAQTKRTSVIIDVNRAHIDKLVDVFHGQLFMVGDASDSDVLMACGINEALGLFAITGDDNENLVISLTAKQLNPHLRVVANCHDLKNAEKMKMAGADAVVSPSYIGGMRMASEMIRSTAVSFLDTMLRDREKNLRVEEFTVPEAWFGHAIERLNFKQYPSLLLLAVKTEAAWIYNPSPAYVLNAGDTLIFMITPEERGALEAVLKCYAAQGD
ncbi:TrkA family potassium uptake protein [Legionella sp. MW5194]|uniref:potassium channel family protein n=1 Tax=Legionella sp. MW5194 TaxID=2662448 RepID=UPI00193CC918|nr:potassium channel protein [Legionella sp. MW5194]